MNVTRQAGFTLVELMVAATLGLLILAGAISMFITNKRIYTEQDKMGRLQENARFAMDMLIRDIRMAGHAGCSDDVSAVSNDLIGAGAAASLYNFTPIEGSESTANWQPSNSTQDVGMMLVGSDSITIRYLADTDIYTMTPTMSVAASQIFTSGSSGIVAGDIIAIADCNSADIVVATNMAPTGAPGCASTGPTDAGCLDTVTHAIGVVAGAEPGNAVPLSRNYDAKATILRYVTHRYFVGNDAGGDPVLYRRSSEFNPATPQVVIEGVENMQILYGVDTDSDQIADTYVNGAAGSIADWDDVLSVRISLLIRSIEEYGAKVDTATYNLLGAIINPIDDRRRRRVFTTTIRLRNRI